MSCQLRHRDRCHGLRAAARSLPAGRRGYRRRSEGSCEA